MDYQSMEHLYHQVLAEGDVDRAAVLADQLWAKADHQITRIRNRSTKTDWPALKRLWAERGAELYAQMEG